MDLFLNVSTWFFLLSGLAFWVLGLLVFCFYWLCTRPIKEV